MQVEEGLSQQIHQKEENGLLDLWVICKFMSLTKQQTHMKKWLHDTWTVDISIVFDIHFFFLQEEYVSIAVCLSASQKDYKSGQKKTPKTFRGWFGHFHKFLSKHYINLDRGLHSLWVAVRLCATLFHTFAQSLWLTLVYKKYLQLNRLRCGHAKRSPGEHDWDGGKTHITFRVCFVLRLGTLFHLCH